MNPPLLASGLPVKLNELLIVTEGKNVEMVVGSKEDRDPSHPFYCSGIAGGLPMGKDDNKVEPTWERQVFIIGEGNKQR